MPYLTQTAYAAHRGISQPMVAKYVKKGAIDDALKDVSGKQLIDRDKADILLDRNLDQIQRQAQAKAKISNGKPKPKVEKEEYIQPSESEVKEMQSKVKKAGVSQLSLSEAQRIQAQFKAALLKLEYEEKSKSLVKREQVDADFFNVARRVRDSILNIPDRIGAELASSTDIFKVKEILTKSLIQSLEELSNAS